MGRQVCEVPGHSVSCSREIKRELEVEPYYQISAPTPMTASSTKVLPTYHWQVPQPSPDRFWLRTSAQTHELLRGKAFHL